MVILPSFLDIGSCEDLHRTLSDALTGLNKPLVIEAGEVERITTPAIQLILATGLAAEALSQQCTIGHPSEAMERSFAELGLTAELEKRRA
ncbi:MAG: STAS domain-containing protein [Rickettsiales bacterium]